MCTWRPNRMHDSPSKALRSGSRITATGHRRVFRSPARIRAEELSRGPPAYFGTGRRPAGRTTLSRLPHDPYGRRHGSGQRRRSRRSREREWGDHGLTSGRARRRRSSRGPAAIGSHIDSVMQYVDSRLDAAVERMITLCRLCSVATEGAEAAEQRARAEMFVEELRGIGFSAGVRDTPGPPIVVGHDRRSRGPSVLFCGHYDAWPARRYVTRRKGEATQSASTVAANPYNADQSTQLMAFVEACRAWKAVTGQLPTPVSVLVVGERRSGSVRLTSILRMYADELNADIGIAPAARISCYAVPTINSMLRGLCCEEFTIVAADRDQLARPRSGASADPTRILARIIGDLQDQFGCVAIPGFYDGVDASLRPPLAPREASTEPASSRRYRYGRPARSTASAAVATTADGGARSPPAHSPDCPSTWSATRIPMLFAWPFVTSRAPVSPRIVRSSFSQEARSIRCDSP